jgi:hypothetical protein
MVASERADLRNWSMLPESIHVVRLDAAQAKILNLSGRGYGDAESEKFGQIDLSIDPKKTIYLIRSLH